MSLKEQVIARVDFNQEVLARSPIAKGVIDGGLSMIPFLGTAIMSALDTRTARLYQENSERFAQEVAKRVSELDEEKLDKEYIQSDEFVSVLIEILLRNARTHEREKVALYARLFTNTVTSDLSRVPFKEGLVRIIDELSVEHVHILSYISDRDTAFTDEDRTNNRDSTTVEEISASLGITEARVLAYCEQMSRFGLLRDWFIGRYDYHRGHYEITGYGRQLATFLTLENERSDSEV